MQSRARRRGPRTAGPSLTGLAAAFPLIVLAVVLLLRHSTISETGRFLAFVALGVVLPGFALWRLIGGYHRNLVEDTAAGFAVGTAAQLIVYLASASVGLQAWSWVWIPLVLVVAVVDSDARARVWRPVEEPLRPLQAWLLTAALSIVLVVTYRNGPARFLPAFADPLRSDPALAFHQALAASAKYDVPISTLWLGGEPMRYHTFSHQFLAATAWNTRIDLTVLVQSLVWLPLLLAGCALVFALTARFTEKASWAGSLAVLVVGLGGSWGPLREGDSGQVAAAVWAYLSPPQALGLVIAPAFCLVVVDLLRRQQPRSRWVLPIGLAIVAVGVKATILPLAAGGFLLTFLILTATKRATRTALTAGLLMVAIGFGALLTLLGGQTWGTQLMVNEELLTDWRMLLSWALACCGVLFLRRPWRDPGAVFLLGFALAGLAGTLLTTQTAPSQVQFLRTAFPVIAALACAGLANLVRLLLDRRVLVRAASAVVGTGVAVAMLGATVFPVFAKPQRGGPTEAEAAAARFLRDNSRPGELIATNAHCLAQTEAGCDSRHYWLAALSERPVLLEGWSGSNRATKTAMAAGTAPLEVPFWNRDLLAINDAVFVSPSAPAVERLRRAGVKWLYADRRAGEVSPQLKEFVRIRHATLDATIYEIR
jgi:hypothetical protein